MARTPRLIDRTHQFFRFGNERVEVDQVDTLVRFIVQWSVLARDGDRESNQRLREIAAAAIQGRLQEISSRSGGGKGGAAPKSGGASLRADIIKAASAYSGQPRNRANVIAKKTGSTARYVRDVLKKAEPKLP